MLSEIDIIYILRNVCYHYCVIAYCSQIILKVISEFLQLILNQYWKNDCDDNKPKIYIQVIVREPGFFVDSLENEILIRDRNSVNTKFSHDWNFFIKSTLQNRWALKYKGIILSVLVWVEFNILVILGWRKNSASDHVSKSKKKKNKNQYSHIRKEKR